MRSAPRRLISLTALANLTVSNPETANLRNPSGVKKSSLHTIGDNRGRIYLQGEENSAAICLSVLDTHQTVTWFIFWVDILSANNFSLTLSSHPWENISLL